MGNIFAKIAFTDTVRELQTKNGSRTGYSKMDQGVDYNYILSANEIEFISSRDSFYMASVSETNWPYLQHRGGPVGFMRIIDEKTIGFADFQGNRQYVSTGNFINNNRVALFFMDYPNKRRLKVLGRVRIVNKDEPTVLSSLKIKAYQAVVDRGFVIDVDAFDWNCPQFITPRYSHEEIETLLMPLIEDKLRANNQIDKNLDQAIGEGPLQLIITGIKQLSTEIRAYELKDVNAKKLPSFDAGAHLILPIKQNTGQIQHRHYSITSSPNQLDHYEIAVLREQYGSGGSINLHDSYQLGMQLCCHLPKSQFRLHDDERPSVLIAGGIGITPIRSMAKYLKQNMACFELHYAAQSKSQMAYSEELKQEFDENLHRYNSNKSQRMDIEAILKNAADDAVFYICGPQRLIDDVVDKSKKLEIDCKRIRFEQFKAALGDNEKPISVKLSKSLTTIEVSPDQTILDAMLEAGVDAPYSCRAGNCRTCAVTVLEGEPEHRDHVLNEHEKNEQKLMCTCISRASSDQLILDL